MCIRDSICHSGGQLGGKCPRNGGADEDVSVPYGLRQTAGQLFGVCFLGQLALVTLQPGGAAGQQDAMLIDRNDVSGTRDLQHVDDGCAGGAGAVLDLSLIHILQQNLVVAADKELPICQDTGMACVFIELGQDAHISGDLTEAVNEGCLLYTSRCV